MESKELIKFYFWASTGQRIDNSRLSRQRCVHDTVLVETSQCAGRSKARMRTFETFQSWNEGVTLYTPSHRSVIENSLSQGREHGRRWGDSYWQWVTELLSAFPVDRGHAHIPIGILNRGPYQAPIVKSHDPPGLQPFSITEIAPTLLLPRLLSPGWPNQGLFLHHA